MNESILPNDSEKIDVNAPELVFIGTAEELTQDTDELNMKELIDEAHKRNDGIANS